MSRTQLPAPLEVPWTLKPLSSAESGLEVLDDGRLRLWIRHDLLAGVTPEMLVWWFHNMEGDLELEGRWVSRYRAWHPLDHVAFRYARRPAPLGQPPRAVFHIHEVLARNPAWEIDVLSDVSRLDEGGFTHRPRIAGIHPGVIDYSFERTAGGTLYRNSIVVGIPGKPALVRPLNALIRRFTMPDEKGRAWLRHNVEEVGAFEHFLPKLFAEEAQGKKQIHVAV